MEAMHQFIGMLAHCPVFLCYSLDAGHPSVRRSGAISRIRFQSVQWRFALYANGLGGKAEQRAMKDAEVSELSARISETQAFAGLIVRDRNPENLEFPFSALNSFITSNEQFFVRSHFGVPKLERDAWRLIIEGRVRQPCELLVQ